MASGAAVRFGVEPLSIVITRKQPQLFVSRPHLPAQETCPRSRCKGIAIRRLKLALGNCAGPSPGWRRELPGKGPAWGIR